MAILDMEFGEGATSSKGEGGRKRERKRASEAGFKRPEGMHRELYALLVGDNKEPPPIISTESGLPGGYKQVKAKLGLKKARAWKWMEFVNPGRSDGFRLRHWRREVDGGKEYPFAKFNKQVAIESYTDQEYAQHLHHDDWTKSETDHLFELCKRFDLRFIVIHDRWDRERFGKQRSVEDLKERYYQVHNFLTQIRHPDQDIVRKNYDATHERKRKDQLIKLYNRSPEQLEEEQELLDEYRKIEQRKKERERKTQDLQKLITDANTSKQKQQQQQRVDSVTTASQNKSQSRSNRKKVSGSSHRVSGSKEQSASGTQFNLMDAGIKFPEIKNAGPYARSQRMKLPGSVGQKKSKAIEQLLTELSIESRPMATAEIVLHFNELRSDMVLLYELKMALANSEFELQTLKHQYEALKSDAEERQQQQSQPQEVQEQQQPQDQGQEERVQQQSSQPHEQQSDQQQPSAASAEASQLLHESEAPTAEETASGREGIQ